MAKDDAQRKRAMADFMRRLHLHYINEIVKRGASQNEFSLWLELPENTVSRVMRGSSMPSLETMIAIAKRGGPEVYDICGVPRLESEDPGVRELNELYFGLTPEERQALLKNAREIKNEKKTTLAPTSELVRA